MKTVQVFVRIPDRGISVYIVAPVPTYKASILEQEALNLCYRPVSWTMPLNDSLSRSAYKAQRLYFDRMVESFKNNVGVHILDPSDVLCPAAKCRAVKDGFPFYYDDSHLNEQ